jgi:hypothetical protein
LLFSEADLQKRGDLIRARANSTPARPVAREVVAPVAKARTISAPASTVAPTTSQQPKAAAPKQGVQVGVNDELLAKLKKRPGTNL